MRAMLAVSILGLGLGLTAAQCGAGGGPSGTGRCEVMELTDTIEAFASGGMVYAASKDTVPRPRGSCLTLQAKDTVPRP